MNDPNPSGDSLSDRMRKMANGGGANNDVLSRLPQAKPQGHSLEPDFMPPSAAKQADKREPRPKEKEPFTTREKLLRSLWTLTSVISMTINVIFVIVLALVFMYFPRGYKLPEEIGPKTLTNLLQGLYENFELMDAAHITASIQVQDEIPVQFDLKLNQATNVVLSEDVAISGAYVVINTAVIDISAPAVVTLPAGTVLPILLDLSVPVDTTVPVNLTVDVNIPLEETDLHAPFVGLQDVVRPLYCLVEPKAASIITQEGICNP